MMSLKPVGGSSSDVVPCLCPKGLTSVGCDDIPLAHPSYAGSILPLPPTPTRPTGKIGQIVWPCWGLTRYAVGHVAVKASHLQQLLDFSGWANGGRYVDVTLEDNRAVPFSLRMQVFAYRPYNDPREEASEDVDADAEQVWVLTLCDYRYHMADDRGRAATLTWGDLIARANAIAYGSTLGTAAAINTLLNATSPNYPTPIAEWWDQTYIQGAGTFVAVDAACAATNTRAVVKANGDWALEDATAAATSWAAWWDAWGSRSMRGGLIDGSKERPLKVDYQFTSSSGQYRNSTDWSGGTGFAGHLGIDLNYLSTSAAMDDYRTRFSADMGSWFDIGLADASFVGLLPVPESSVPYSVVYTDDGVTCETRIERGPARFPWPLVRRLETLRSGVDYQNTVASDVGVRSINEADNATGIYNETAATPTRNVQKLYAATASQAGAVSTSNQKWAGEKQLVPSGRFIATNVTGGITAGAAITSLSTGDKFAFAANTGIGAAEKSSYGSASSLLSGAALSISDLHASDGYHADVFGTAAYSLGAYAAAVGAQSVTVGGTATSVCGVSGDIPYTLATNPLGTSIRTTVVSSVPILEANNSLLSGGVGGLAFETSPTLFGAGFVYASFGHFALSTNTGGYTPASAWAVGLTGDAASSSASQLVFAIECYDTLTSQMLLFPGINRNFAAGEYPIVRGGIIVGYTT